MKAYLNPAAKRPLLILIISVMTVMQVFSSIKLENLTVEYSRTPMGIDVLNPRFSWQMVSTEGERMISQSSYEIVVNDPSGNIMWNSGWIDDGKSVGIVYSGLKLEASTRYSWNIRIKDQKGKISSGSSWFETGLMNGGISAWEGARWIGGTGEDLVLRSGFLTVFKIHYTVQLDKASGSVKASFVLGANDERLMDRNKNIFNIESKKDQSYLKFEFDVSKPASDRDSSAFLNIFRVGYHPDDSAEKPFMSLAIPKSIINGENIYLPHTIYLESIFGTFNIYIDVADNSHRLGNFSAGSQGRPGGGGGINLNPVGQGGNYISFPLLGDIGFSAGKGQIAKFSDLIISNYREPSNTLFVEDPSKKPYSGIFSAFNGNPESGLRIEGNSFVVSGGNSGTFIVADPSHNSMPMLRTEFDVKKKPERARLYVTARGIYEIYLNGKKVGNDYFNPGLSQYNITHMYQTYDVTEMMAGPGRNALGACLGEGWWSGNITFSGNNWNFFGDRQSLLLKLVITYNDGTRSVITSNDTDWKYFNDGPVEYGSFFQGECYNSLKEPEVKGWDMPGYNDSRWKKAVVVPLDGTTFSGTGSLQTGGRPGSTITYEDFSLTGQIGENAGIVKLLETQSMKEVRPGVYVYDMGQNMVGVPSVNLKNCKAGQKITLRYAEVLYPDLKKYGENQGMIMLENIRAALAQDTYIAKSGDNIIQPRFTFHGYRFLEITGIEAPVPLSDVKGLVISSIKDLTADYVTSNEKVNRLFQNIVWSQYGNFLSIPTDCPQRNERMGWSGDISVFSRTATYLANVDQFFRKHLMALRNTQGSNGKFSDVAPVGGGFGGLLWGSAGITIPWETWEQYGDKSVLEEHYAAMVSYIDYLSGTINKETGVSSDGALGDWLGPQNNQLGQAYLTTAYHIYDLWVMKSVAEVLGRKDDYQRFAKMYDDRKAFFNGKFVNSDHITMGLIGGGGFGPGGPQGRTLQLKSADTQTSYAVGLALDAFNEENRPYAVENLVNACKRENKDDNDVLRPAYSLMTGFIGTAWITKALSDNGNSATAYRLLQQETYPSWLYPVNNGATSIWERLNSYTVEDGFGDNNSMNSFNHYSFGAVGQWLIGYSLGIGRDEPGFKRFVLRPEPDPDGKMTWAKGYYDSMYGKIESSWKNSNGNVTYEFTVPANTAAILYLPAASADTVKESGKPVKKAKGVRFIKFEDGKAVFEVQSGRYSFNSELSN